jgi:DNA-binding MarR family transcriptional regulator
MEQTEMLIEITKLIRRVSTSLDTLDRCALVSMGLSPSQSRVISVIDRDFFFTHTILSKQCSMSKSTLSEALKTMEQNHLIERTKYRGDKRKKYINLTARGKAVRAALLSNGCAEGAFETIDMTQLEKKLLYILLKKLEYQLGITT